MDILEVSESPTKEGGLNVRFSDGTREFNFHLHDDMQGPRAAQLRVLLKGYKGTVLSVEEVRERREKETKTRIEKVNKAKIKRVNDQLKELGSREIKTLEEIPNAKAFIQFERARIFREAEGK